MLLLPHKKKKTPGLALAAKKEIPGNSAKTAENQSLLFGLVPLVARKGTKETFASLAESQNR